MGICKNCIHIGERRERLHGEDYFCNNEQYDIVDYITGEIKHGSCRLNNGHGECLLFDDGTTPDPSNNDDPADDTQSDSQDA